MWPEGHVWKPGPTVPGYSGGVAAYMVFSDK
jgi:hypothetical protein